jgi:uncharacterized protein YcbK (DUF882 family)
VKKQKDKPINYLQISEHFNLREFQSPDTEEVKIYPEVIEKLEQLRMYIDKPIMIHSAYRTALHNRKVGGVKNSYHCQGMAVDISSLGVSLDELKKYALAVGFKGIGIYRTKGFIHLDIGPERTWEE